MTQDNVGIWLKNAELSICQKVLCTCMHIPEQDTVWCSLSSPAWQFEMLSFVDKCWTTFVSPLGLIKIMESCCASQEKNWISLRIFLAGSRGFNSLLEKSVLLIIYVSSICILKVNTHESGPHGSIWAETRPERILWPPRTFLNPSWPSVSTFSAQSPTNLKIYQLTPDRPLQRLLC